MPIFLFFLPGMLLIFFRSFIKKGLTEFLVYTVALSISFFIAMPWFIRVFGVPLQFFTYLIFISSLLLLIVNYKKVDLKGFIFDKNEIIILAAFVLILLLRLVPLTFQPVPAGIEISRQAYTARLIYENDGIPSPVPFPVGLPLISAQISSLSNIPVYLSSFILSCVSYALLTFGLYILLLRFFKRNTAAYSAVAATFLTKTPQWLIGRGDDHSVLAVFLFLVALSLGIEIFNKISRPKTVFLLLSLTAALLTDTLFLISFASVSIVYALVFALIIKRFENTLKVLPIIFVIIGLLFYCVFYLRSSAAMCPATHADMEAFKWIDVTIGKKAVFLVNESDAGIWIPAATGRLITGVSRHDGLNASYIYLGSKPVGKSDLKREDLEKKPWKFIRIFSKDSAQVWKIL